MVAVECQAVTTTLDSYMQTDSPPQTTTAEIQVGSSAVAMVDKGTNVSIAPETKPPAATNQMFATSDK